MNAPSRMQFAKLMRSVFKDIAFRCLLTAPKLMELDSVLHATMVIPIFLVFVWLLKLVLEINT